MGKWLAIAAVGILVVLVVMWKQLGATSATAAPPPRPAPAIATTAPIQALPAPAATPTEVAPAPTPDEPQKMDVESDAFFYKFQEVVPAQLSRNAVKCYEGISKRVHRNQSLVLNFKTKIRSGVVTITDVKIDTDTLGDPALTSCFLQEVQRTTWTDPALPDWEADDQLVLNPERGMKKYTRENIEYVGEPAPRD